MCKSFLCVKASLCKGLLCVKNACSVKKHDEFWEVLCASFVVQSSTGTYFVQALWYWDVPCASLVVQRSTGKYAVQAW